jgi:hypothetical protein
MKHGLRRLGLLLAVCAVAAASASAADAYVYWTIAGPASLSSPGGTAIGRANLDASGVTHGLVTGLGNANAIAIDATHIYWINASTASIGRANLNGTGASSTWIQPTRAPVGLALDASHIYWTDGSLHVGRANLDGTGADSNWLPTSPAATGVQGIAVTPTALYVGAAGQIATMPLPAGTGLMTTLTTLPVNAQAIAMAVANGYLYWVSNDPIDTAPASSIDRIQLGGAHTVNPGYIPNLYSPFGVAVDGANLYWSDDMPGVVQLGKALISSGAGATNINYSFISEPGGPGGVAVDANIDPTRTTLGCSATVVPIGTPATCTVTVTDSASSALAAGTINLTGNGAAFFSGNPCTLTPNGSGGASCVIGAVPTTSGTQSLHAAYSGDAVHGASAGDVTICAGTATQCGGGSNPPSLPPPKCKVPRLKGKSLPTARKLLSSAHCRLGKVKRPRVPKHRKLRPLLVRSQSPSSGRLLAGGTKVALVLVEKPKPVKRRR